MHGSRAIWAASSRRLRGLCACETVRGGRRASSRRRLAAASSALPACKQMRFELGYEDPLPSIGKRALANANLILIPVSVRPGTTHDAAFVSRPWALRGQAHQVTTCTRVALLWPSSPHTSALSARPAHPSPNRLFYLAGSEPSATLAMAAKVTTPDSAEVRLSLDTDETALNDPAARRRSRTSSSNRPAAPTSRRAA